MHCRSAQRRRERLTNREALIPTLIAVVAALLILVVEDQTVRYVLGGFIAVSYITAIRILVLRKRRRLQGGGDG